MTDLSGKKCLLDTNILVSFLNREHIHHSIAKSLFEKVIDFQFQAIISVQNILELSAVLVHGFGRSRKEASFDISNFTADSLFEVIYIDFRVLTRFFSLMKEETSLHITDLFLLATAIENNVEVIVTGDKTFQRIKTKEIKVYNPF